MHIKNATPLKKLTASKNWDPSTFPPFWKFGRRLNSPSSRYTDNTSMKISNTPFFKTTLLYQLHPSFGKIWIPPFSKILETQPPPFIKEGGGGVQPWYIFVSCLWSWFVRILSEWLIITHCKIYFWGSSPCFGFAIQAWF